MNPAFCNLNFVVIYYLPIASPSIAKIKPRGLSRTIVMLCKGLNYIDALFKQFMAQVQGEILMHRPGKISIRMVSGYPIRNFESTRSFDYELHGNMHFPTEN